MWRVDSDPTAQLCYYYLDWTARTGERRASEDHQRPEGSDGYHATGDATYEQPKSIYWRFWRGIIAVHNTYNYSGWAWASPEYTRNRKRCIYIHFFICAWSCIHSNDSMAMLRCHVVDHLHVPHAQMPRGRYVPWLVRVIINAVKSWQWSMWLELKAITAPFSSSL